MNTTVARQSFRTSWAGFLWYALGIVVSLVGMQSIVADKAKVFSSAMDAFPKGMLDAFQINVATFGTPVGYISAEWLSLMWPFVLVAFVAGGAAAIAGMVEDGTIHFELSLPITRVAWLLGRFLTSALWLAAFMLVTVASLYIITPAAWWRFGLLGFAFGFLTLGFAYAVAAASPQRTLVYSAVFGLFILQWLLATVAGSSSSAVVKALGHLSVWGDFRPEAVVTGGVNWAPVVLWLALGSVFVAFAAWRWRTRDIPA